MGTSEKRRGQEEQDGEGRCVHHWTGIELQYTVRIGIVMIVIVININIVIIIIKTTFIISSICSIIIWIPGRNFFLSTNSVVPSRYVWMFPIRRIAWYRLDISCCDSVQQDHRPIVTTCSSSLLRLNETADSV